MAQSGKANHDHQERRSGGDRRLTASEAFNELSDGLQAAASLSKDIHDHVQENTAALVGLKARLDGLNNVQSADHECLPATVWIGILSMLAAAFSGALYYIAQDVFEGLKDVRAAVQLLNEEKAAKHDVRTLRDEMLRSLDHLRNDRRGG